MAEKTDDLVIGVSTDMSSVQRALKKLDGDIARAGSQIEKRFAAVGKGIDRAFPTNIQDRINKMVGAPTAATKEWTGALVDQGKELDRLRAKFNPVFSTITSYKSAISEIRTAHRLGAISADEMAAAIQRERQAALQSVAAIKQRNSALADRPNSMGGAGFATSNIAAQFQDIGVTAAMGQSPLTIALQQGTQLSAVLNQMGGARSAIAGLGAAFMSIVNPVSLVTIGVVAATAAAVQYGMSVFAATEDTEEALQKQADLVERVARQWGEALPQVKAYADELARTRDLEEARGASAATISKEYRAASAALGSFLEQVESSDPSAFNEGAMAMVDNTVRLQNAVGELEQAQKEGKSTTDEYQRVLKILSDLTTSSAIPATGNLRDAVDLLTGAYSAAADEAQRAADAQAILDKRGGIALSGFAGGRGSNPKTLETDPYWRSRYLPDPESPAKKSRSGRGGLSDAEKEKKAIDDVVASLKFEQEQLSRTAIEQRTYNELKRAGVDLNSQAGQKIATLVAQIESERVTIEANKKAIEDQSAAFTNLFQMGTDALTGIVDGSMKAEDALKKLIVQIALAALQAKLLGTGPLAGLFGGFNPTVGGFASMLGLSEGGYTGSGGKYEAKGVVHGGEYVFSKEATAKAGVANLEAMHRSLRGYSAGGPVGMPSVPSPRGRAANDNRPGIADVRVWVDKDGNWQAAVERISRGQAQQVTANGLKAYDKTKQRQQMTGG